MWMFGSELLQQTLDVVEFLRCALGFAGPLAELFEDFARPRQIGLIGNLDRAAGHGACLIERPAERIGALALLIVAGAWLLAVGRHDVLGKLLGAVAQLIERALLGLL